jgi:uncharacterized protein
MAAVAWVARERGRLAARVLALATALLLVLVLLPSARAQAQALQPVPPLSARVVDTIGLLDAPARADIEAKLAALERDKGAQVAFLIVASSQPEDIASYANRVGNAWKIGRQGVGDGVLLVVARDDRKLRIEVAKTLEGAIPDLAAKQIIDEAITPAFRRGDYATGLLQAADQIDARVRGEPLPEPRHAAASGGGEGFDFQDLAIFLFVAVPVIAAVLRGIFGRKLGAALAGGGAGLVAWLVSSSVAIAVLAALVALVLSIAGGVGPLARHGRGNRGHWGPPGGGWGGGGWSSGAGTGGFSSGGGGDFGGGGASGDW